MSSTTLARIQTEDLWITRPKAASYLGASEASVRRYVREGALREFRGRTIWVSRDDLSYIIRCRQQRTRPLHVGARFSAPETLSPRMTGRDALSWAVKNQHAPLVLPLPETAVQASGASGGASSQEMSKRLEHLEATVAELMVLRARPRASVELSDENVEVIYRKVTSALAAEYFTAQQVEEWLGFLEEVGDAHLARFMRWAKDHPIRTQELCGHGIHALAPLWRMAALIRQFARAAFDGSAEAATLRSRADAAYRHMEDACQSRILTERTLLSEGSRWLEVGMSPIDRRMLRRLRTHGDTKYASRTSTQEKKKR